MPKNIEGLFVVVLLCASNTETVKSADAVEEDEVKIPG